MSGKSLSLNKPGKRAKEVEAQLGFSRAERGVVMRLKTEQELTPQRVETCPRTELLRSSLAKIRQMNLLLGSLSADQPVSRNQSASQNELKNLTTKLKRNL